MRILHTSDWHLGRTFVQASLLDDQQQFLDWLVATVVAERIDLVVVAGDVFDRAVAPTEAVVMFRDVLRRLAGRTKVAVITGNHDGADRVATYGDLLDLSGVLVRGGYGSIGEVLTVSFDDGPLDVVLLPFLDPQVAPDDYPSDDASVVKADGTGDGTGDAFARRIRRTHQSVLATAADVARASLRSPRSLAVAHAFVTGGTVSDSERQLVVGGTGTVEASIFAPFSYTALGHLHRPQDVAAPSGRVRYSGTPLAYSFSEQHAKSITIVDLAADGACTVTEVPVPVGRAVLTVTGAIDDLLAATPSPAAADSWVRVVLTDPGVVLDSKARLAQVYPHVIEILHEPTHTGAELVAGLGAGRRRSMTAAEVAGEFWRAANQTDPSDDERELLFAALATAESEAQAR